MGQLLIFSKRYKINVNDTTKIFFFFFFGDLKLICEISGVFGPILY